MAVSKKAAKRTATQKAQETVAKHIHVVEITPADFFAAVAKAVSGRAQATDVPPSPPAMATLANQLGADATTQKQMGAEQQARQMAEISYKLYAVAAEVRDRIVRGACIPQAERANQAKETEGPIKDALGVIGYNMDCTFACLDDISRYIGQ